MTGHIRKTIIAGNWKMNKTKSEARSLADEVVQGVRKESDLPEVVLCPPFTALAEVCAAVAGTPVQVGAQNMDYRESGAFTGEISPLMLTDLKVKYVILGHSERRQFFGETNQSVNLKVKAALKHKLIPIMCVGETLDERENNLTDSVVRRQVGAGLAEISEEDVEKVVVAYEPVWAIGTGKVCEADEANRVIGLIRNTISDLFPGKKGGKVGERISILYGGSVNPGNIDEQMGKSDIDGSLVGGASLKSSDFLALIKAGEKRVRLSLSKA